MNGKAAGSFALFQTRKAALGVKAVRGQIAVRGAEVHGGDAGAHAEGQQFVQERGGQPRAARGRGHEHLAQGGLALADVQQGHGARHRARGVTGDPEAARAQCAAQIETRHVQQVRLVGQGDRQAEFAGLDAEDERGPPRRGRRRRRARWTRTPRA